MENIVFKVTDKIYDAYVSAVSSATIAVTEGVIVGGEVFGLQADARILAGLEAARSDMNQTRQSATPVIGVAWEKTPQWEIWDFLPIPSTSPNLYTPNQAVPNAIINAVVAGLYPEIYPGNGGSAAYMGNTPPSVQYPQPQNPPNPNEPDTEEFGCPGRPFLGKTESFVFDGTTLRFKLWFGKRHNIAQIITPYELPGEPQITVFENETNITNELDTRFGNFESLSTLVNELDIPPIVNMYYTETPVITGAGYVRNFYEVHTNSFSPSHYEFSNCNPINGHSHRCPWMHNTSEPIPQGHFWLNVTQAGEIPPGTTGYVYDYSDTEQYYSVGVQGGCLSYRRHEEAAGGIVPMGILPGLLMGGLLGGLTTQTTQTILANLLNMQIGGGRRDERRGN